MLVFVYGTLRKRDCRAGVLDGYECVAEEAFLQGFDMLHLGGFPGIVPGEGIVKGELYEIDDEILRRLDGIEGFREDDPKHSLYLREKVAVDVYDEEEEETTYEDVFTYVFNREPGQRATIIESGDWFESREQRRHLRALS